jgi:hypothetical protein
MMGGMNMGGMNGMGMGGPGMMPGMNGNMGMGMQGNIYPNFPSTPSSFPPSLPIRGTPFSSQRYSSGSSGRRNGTQHHSGQYRQRPPNQRSIGGSNVPAATLPVHYTELAKQFGRIGHGDPRSSIPNLPGPRQHTSYTGSSGSCTPPTRPNGYAAQRRPLHLGGMFLIRAASGTKTSKIYTSHIRCYVVGTEVKGLVMPSARHQSLRLPRCSSITLPLLPVSERKAVEIANSVQVSAVPLASTQASSETNRVGVVKTTGTRMVRRDSDRSRFYSNRSSLSTCKRLNAQFISTDHHTRGPAIIKLMIERSGVATGWLMSRPIFSSGGNGFFLRQFTPNFPWSLLSLVPGVSSDAFARC